MFLPRNYEQQMLHSAVIEAITKPFLSLRVFIDEKLAIEDEAIELMNCFCKYLTMKHASLYTPSFQVFLLLHDLQFSPQTEQSYISNFILSS